MSIVVTLWWFSFWTALGLCLGSFLNAVIYRLPRHGSLRIPRWSACPNCEHRIAWYDNLPILSFMLLRGKCRHCGLSIATRYVVVEAAMAVIVLLLLDAFFVSHTRAGLSNSPFGLTDDLSYDWPIFAAHIVLFACLLSMSAIDLEHYWVDVRFTNLATIVGFVMHALWTPPHSKAWLRPSDTTAFVAVSVMVGLGLAWILMICWPHQEHDEAESSVEPLSEPPTEGGLASSDPAVARPVSSRAFGWVAGLMLVGLFVVTVSASRGSTKVPPAVRGLVPLLFFFLLIVRESTVLRASDQEIIDAIEEERPNARKMAMKELLLLLPALVFGVAGFLIMRYSVETSARISELLHTPVHFSALALTRHWSPLWGLATAATGFVIAGALGWAVRIFFTLVFGKEAFGTGDIHLLAAAGCVAGWPVAVLAFFIATGLAMLGWLLALPFKRPRAIPLGPWLSLGFLGVVIFYGPLIAWPPIANVVAAVQFVLATPSVSR